MTDLSGSDEQYVLPALINRFADIFPDYTLAEKDKILPGNRVVDLHFKDKDDNDVFIEIRTSLTRQHLGDLIDLYSSILNSQPGPKKPKFIVLGDKVDYELRRELSKLNITALTYGEFDVSMSDIRAAKVMRRKRKLTPTEAKIVAGLQGKGTRIVDKNLIYQQIGMRNGNYARQLLHRLEKKKWLERISNGNYIFIPPEYGYEMEARFPPMDPFVVASSLVEPYYLSYGSANSYYGLTAQIPSTIYLATTMRKPQFTWRNIVFRFVTLTREKFFGYRKVCIDNTKISIAEIEKAVIDSVDKLDYGGGLPEVVGVVYHAINKIDRHKLASYAKKMNSHAVCQRLGYIVDFLATHNYIAADKRFSESLKPSGHSPIYLDNSRPRGGQYFERWRVYDNAGYDELISEIRIT